MGSLSAVPIEEKKRDSLPSHQAPRSLHFFFRSCNGAWGRGSRVLLIRGTRNERGFQQGIKKLVLHSSNGLTNLSLMSREIQFSVLKAKHSLQQQKEKHTDFSKHTKFHKNALQTSGNFRTHFGFHCYFPGS